MSTAVAELPAVKIPAVKCSAHTSSGRPCRAWAIQGGTVCRTHGGSAPQVREAARRRIQERAGAAVELAWRMIEDPTTPAPVRARLLIDWQDRAGLKPADVLALSVADETERPDLDARIAAALELRGLGPAPDIVDGELVDEDTPGHTHEGADAQVDEARTSIT